MVQWAQDTVLMKGRNDVGHIPYQPFWLFIVRCVQMLFATIVLALSCVAGSGYYFAAGDGVGIFAFIWTLLFLGYIEISIFFVPGAYNKYIHLVLECLSVLFWLITFALLATLAVAWDIIGYGTSIACGYDAYNNYVCDKKLKPRYDYGAAGGATKGATAIAALNWVLFIGSLIAFGIYLHRHRRTEGEARQAGITGNAVVEEHKLESMGQPQPVQYAQPVNVQQPTGYDHATNGYPQQPQQYPQQPQGVQGYNSVPVDARYAGQ